LETCLKKIDRQGYKHYREIQGIYRFPDFILAVDHVQGDPFAAPSRICASVPVGNKISPVSLDTPVKKTAAEDFLGRRFRHFKSRIAKGTRGMGKSGLIDIDSGGQAVLRRNAVVIKNGMVEFRFVVGLPSVGRRILGKEAIAVFIDEIPAIVSRTMDIPLDELNAFIHSVEDQESLRLALDKKGLVAFIPDQSLLPRKSGVDDRPLQDGVPFISPESLRVTIETPNGDAITGMGIPKGVTLIVGGDFMENPL